MKKKFLKSTFLLLIGGFITKILGMIIKIVMNRNIGLEGVSLYSLILPTFSLCITIGQIGLPITLSRLVALKTKNNKNLYFTVFPFIMIFNVVFMLLILATSTIIGKNLLHNKDTIILIKAIALVIPFTTISSICRSYFFGKEQMFPHILSNMIENTTRLLIMILLLPKISNLPIKTIVFLIVLSNIISESISTIILIFFLPKKTNLFKNLSFETNYLAETLQLSIPNVSSNMIGNISYFLEPIILTTLNNQNTFITREYGIINGYVLPLLMIPSFFAIAISQSIMPYLSRCYQAKDYQKMKTIIHKVSILLLLFATLITIILELKGDFFLQLLYKNTLGTTYLKLLSPFFILYYLEHPLFFTLHSMGKTKDLLKQSLLSLLVKIIGYVLLSYLFKGIYGYLYTMILNIIITVIYLKFKINYYLKG